MSGKTNNPISLGQIEADLFMAKAAIEKAESMSSKSGKTIKVPVTMNKM